MATFHVAPTVELDLVDALNTYNCRFRVTWKTAKEAYLPMHHHLQRMLNGYYEDGTKKPAKARDAA